MEEQFSRTALLLGQASLERLARASVAVFGVGGVGSFAAEALARSGVGRLALFDNDVVSLSNLNRQLVALHSTLGRAKVDVMKERILDIHPACQVDAHRLFYHAQNADHVDLSAYDYVIDAVDTVSAKLLLIERAHQAGVGVVSSMGAGNKLDPTQFEMTDIYQTKHCPLARVMRRELKKRGIPALRVVYSPELPMTPKGAAPTQTANPSLPEKQREGAWQRSTPGSVAFVPSVAGLMLAGEVICTLAKPDGADDGE